MEPESVLQFNFKELCEHHGEESQAFKQQGAFQ